MIVRFYSRASGEGVEDLQELFKDWLQKVLEEGRPKKDFLVILRAFTRYAEVMPRIRVFASAYFHDEIVVEVFPPQSGSGLSYALYVPDDVDRSELIGMLRGNLPIFC